MGHKKYNKKNTEKGRKLITAFMKHQKFVEKKEWGQKINFVVVRKEISDVI